MKKNSQLKQKTIAGITWNLLGQVAIYVSTLAGTIIMSRLLGPSVFGLFGMLTVFSSLASLFVGFGLSHVIVQHQSLDDKDLTTIFWLNCSLGLTVAIVAFLSADLIGHFYAQPELARVTRVYSIIFLIYGCSAVPLGLLSKRLEFKELVISQLMANAISYGAGIVAAYAGWGVWSLVLQSLVNHLIYVSANYYFSRWRPKLTATSATLGKIAKFSRNLLPSQLLDFLALNLDIMLVGKYFGKEDLGYYGRATALVQLPANSLGNIFNRTFFAVFASLQDDQPTFSASYLRSVKLLTLILMPVLVLTAVLSRHIVLFLFGDQWLGMVPFISILALSAGIGAYNSFNDSVMVSQGRTDLLLRVNAVEKIVLIAGVMIGIRHGILGVAYARAIAAALMFIPKLVMMARVSNLPVVSWLRAQLNLFIGLLLCYGVGTLVRDLTGSLLADLFITSALALSANGIWLFIVREPILDDALDFAKRLYR